jgi:hypothetical protein
MLLTQEVPSSILSLNAGLPKRRSCFYPVFASKFYVRKPSTISPPPPQTSENLSQFTSSKSDIFLFASERHGRAVNVPSSYLTGLGLRSLLLTEAFPDFPQYLPGNAGRVLGHDRFLPNHFQFIIHLSLFHSTLCILSYWSAPLNNVQRSC